jgi:uncharacterized protein YqjF (DUF2071 family)
MRLARNMNRIAEDSLQEMTAARQRLLSLPGEPLFIADWNRVLMIHYEVEPDTLQRAVPFELELNEGRAFVSLVAFTMRGMRPRMGGHLAALFLKPIATHEFLNVRTYVRHSGEPGIYFLAEWLSNRLSVALGPLMFGLPYRYGRVHYEHRWEQRVLAGNVVNSSRSGTLAYHATLPPKPTFGECESGSLEAWLMERYTAFTCTAGKARFFRVWHLPWRQAAVQTAVTEQSLLEKHWPFFRKARIIGANFSPGVSNVWMGRPHRLR